MKTDPRVKLLALLELTTLSLLFNDPRWLLALLLATVLLCILLKTDCLRFLRRVRGFLGLLLAVALLQCLFDRAGEPVLCLGGRVLIYSHGLQAGMCAALRFLVLILAAALPASESSRRLIAGLNGMRLPYTLSFMMMIALRFLPLFRTSFTEAVTSLQLRGVDLRRIPRGQRLRLYAGLMLPVLADAVLKAQDLAVAMELRGFRAYPTRTAYFQVQMHKSDWLLCVLLLAAFIVTLLLWY